MSNLVFASLLIGYFSMDWRIAVCVLVTGGVLFGILFTLTYHNSPREHPRCNPAEVKLIEGDDPVPVGGDGQPQRMSFREMRSRMSPRSKRNFGAFLFQQFSSTFPDVIYSTWLPYFLYKVHGLEDVKMGIFASLPLFGGACGGVVGGFLNDFLIRKIGPRWGRSLVGFSGKMMACLVIATALFYGNEESIEIDVDDRTLLCHAHTSSASLVTECVC